MMEPRKEMRARRRGDIEQNPGHSLGHSNGFFIDALAPLEVIFDCLLQIILKPPSQRGEGRVSGRGSVGGRF